MLYAGASLVQDNKLVKSLVRNTKLGNNSSFEQLFKINASRVYAVAFRLSANPTFAEDITKEVFLTAWQQIMHLREDVSFGLWITGITVYAVLERFRKENNFNKNSVFTGMPYELKNDDLILLEKAVLSLPDKDRIILVLHDIENYTISEVSDFLSIKTDEINKKLPEIRQSINTAGGLQNISLPIEERIKQLPYKIEPKNNLWDDIFNQWHELKYNSSAEEKPKPEDKPEEDSKEKKGIFAWFKKSK